MEKSSLIMLSLEQEIETLVSDYGDLTAAELDKNLMILGFTDRQKTRETIWKMAADGKINFDMNWKIIKNDTSKSQPFYGNDY